MANDYVALVHPELDRDTEELIAEVLGVEVSDQARGHSVVHYVIVYYSFLRGRLGVPANHCRTIVSGVILFAVEQRCPCSSKDHSGRAG